jgi:CHAT domain-containing protein
MFTPLIIGLALLGQNSADRDLFSLLESDFNQFPVTLRRHTRPEDLDKEIRGQHDNVVSKRMVLNATRRLANRNLVSQYDLELTAAQFRYEEAKEAERIAYRALEVYERDIDGWAIPPDESKEYTLLLDWLKARGAMYAVAADFRAFRLAVGRELYRRSAIPLWDWVESQLVHATARAEVDLNRAQQDWVALELAARAGQGAYDSEGQFRTKLAFRRVSVRLHEARAARDQRHLNIIRLWYRYRHQLGYLNPRVLIVLLKTVKTVFDDAIEDLAAERRRLVEMERERADPDNYPLALRRSIELDELDREIRVQRHKVLIQKMLLDINRELARRNLINRLEMEEAVTDVRYQEAWVAERIAYRALVAFQRDARGWATWRDGEKECTLELDWYQAWQAMAAATADLSAFRLVQDRELFRRHAISSAQLVKSQLNDDMARAGVDKIRARQAQTSWRLSMLTGQEADDPGEPLRLALASLRAQVRLDEFIVAYEKNDFEMANDLFSRGFMSCIEILEKQRVFDGATKDLAAERRRLAELETRGERDLDFARTYHNLATSFLVKGDYRKAKSLHERALALRKAVLGEDHPDYASSLDGLASVYEAMGDYGGAEPLLRQAVEIKKRVLGDSHPFYAENVNNMASLYRDMGDLAQTKALMHQALEIRKRAYGDKHPLYALSLNSLAMLYHGQGDFGRAESLAQQAAEILKKAVGEEHPYYALSLNSLAQIYESMGDYDRAEPLVRRGLQIREKVLGKGHPSYANSLHTLARLCRDQGRYDRAELLYHQSLEIKEQVLGKAHPSCSLELRELASLYDVMGDYRRAESLVLQALQIDRKSLELTAAVQSERQQLIMMETLRSGLDAYLSLASRSDPDSTRVYHEVLAWKGSVFARQRQLRLARSRPEIDPEVARLFAKLGETTSRLATLAFTALNPQDETTWKAQLQELTETKEQLERDLSRRSSQFETQQKLARLTPAEVQAALPPATALIDFLEYTHSTPPIRGQGKEQKETHLVAFVVRPDRPIVRLDLGPSAPITSAVDQWRAVFVDFQPAQAPGTADSSFELRRLVWQPLERWLDGVGAVLVSPDGSLARFPLAALPGKRPGSYLIEERPIALVPVPQLLPQLLAKDRRVLGAGGPPPSLLLVGDIDFGAQPGHLPPAHDGFAGHVATRGGWLLQFPPLPSTILEMGDVRTAFQQTNPAGAVFEIRGAEATEAALRSQAPGKRFLHLATHGFFAPPELKSALDRPVTTADALSGPTPIPGQADLFGSQESIVGFHPGLLSGLALAGANSSAKPEADALRLEDGILTALEVAELDLGSTELVVLSACETGLGRSVRGEGLLGLQQAFQVAGARTVVASLWKVNDEVTQQLMSDFYANLWQKHLSPLEALRQAQLRMLNGPDRTGLTRGLGTPGPRSAEETRARVHPRRWAAWVLSGDPGMW